MVRRSLLQLPSPSPCGCMVPQYRKLRQTSGPSPPYLRHPAQCIIHRSIARSTDRSDRSRDRFDRFDKLFAVLPHFGLKYVTNVTSSTSRSILCQSFSLVRRLEAENTLKNPNCDFFCIFINFDSIDSIIHSIRSIIRPWMSLDCPDNPASQ